MKMILGTTIEKRLAVAHGKSLYPDFDIRYLQRWIRLYKNCFPVFVLRGEFESYFNVGKLRWELHNTKSKHYEKLHRYSLS